METQRNNLRQRNPTDGFGEVVTGGIMNPNFAALLGGVEDCGKQPAPIVLAQSLLVAGGVEGFANVVLWAAVGQGDLAALPIETTEGFVEFSGLCVGALGGKVGVAPSSADDLGVDGGKFAGLVPEGFPAKERIFGGGLKLQVDETAGGDVFGFALGNIANKLVGFKVFVAHEFETNRAVSPLFAVAKVPLEPRFCGESVDEFEGIAIEDQDLSPQFRRPIQGF
jgi:hypothetical protein